MTGVAARRAAFVAGRSFVTLVCVAAWSYGVTTYSPFAFDMFVRPQLFPPLSQFVAWFHVWYWAAYAISLLTLLPELRSERRKPLFAAAATYAAVFGGIGVYLLAVPYLATLTTGSRSLIVPGALLPIAWLAAIDHLACGLPFSRQQDDGATPQSQLLMACVWSAIFLWAAHLLIALTAGPTLGWAARATTSGWALVFDLAIFAGVYLVLSFATALAATQPHGGSTEYLMTIAMVAIAIVEFWRRVVLPAFSFGTADAFAIALGLGAATALIWSGLRVRAAVRPRATGITHALSIHPGGSIGAGVVLCLAATLAALGSRIVDSIDWASILHSVIAIAEGGLALGAFLRIFAGRAQRPWSPAAMIVPVIATIAAIHGLLLASTAWTGDARLEPKAIVERLPLADPLAGFAARYLVEQPSFDLDYFQRVLASETTQAMQDPAVPKASLIARGITPPSSRPNIFVFVIDSLRRDYLSPYNPAVSFTPAIDAWARQHFTFRNAFTLYGGTWLSMPSIWSGSAVTRGWGRILPEINTLETFIRDAGYDFVINDFTVVDRLRPDTKRTFLDPEIPSVKTDFCRNLESLQAHLAKRGVNSAPVFAFLAPMNVHILNTGINSPASAGDYPGFYAPYASRLQRLDACFGAFLRAIDKSGVADDSIIVLTSDHGDLLGDDGRWGHQFYLFPQTIRVPLIVQLPKARRTAVTTDLARLTFLTDVTPTLLALSGLPVPDLDTLHGSPLFVAPDREPRARRRDSFKVMSSYGSTYGLLRRNGRLLYISDLLNWREYAFTLFKEPVGEAAAVEPALRRVNQAEILSEISRIEAMYRRN